MTAVIRPARGLDGRWAVPVDYGRAPFLVIWEVTRACALACVHCRADAIARRDPRELTTEEGFLRAPRAVNDGNGFVFVDHIGNIYPSGFLPMARGDAREGHLVATYRDDEVFRQLRDPDALRGRCGRCDLRAVCGGSRSRAFAATGDAFAEDPLCVYQPAESAARLEAPL